MFYSFCIRGEIFTRPEMWAEKEEFIWEPLLSSITRKFGLLGVKGRKLSPCSLLVFLGSPGCYLWLDSPRCRDGAPTLKTMVDLWSGECEYSSLIITPDLWASGVFCYTRRALPEQCPRWRRLESLLMDRKGGGVLEGLTVAAWRRRDNFEIWSICKETQIQWMLEVVILGQEKGHIPEWSEQSRRQMETD